MTKIRDKAIIVVKDEKVLKNTGTETRPFYAKIGTTRWVRFFGILVLRHTTAGNFPEKE